jgi:hypothetical protein
MAHTCPNCYTTCHCQGDIDDIDFGEWDGCRCMCEMERLYNPELYDKFNGIPEGGIE